MNSSIPLKREMSQRGEAPFSLDANLSRVSPRSRAAGFATTVAPIVRPARIAAMAYLAVVPPIAHPATRILLALLAFPLLAAPAAGKQDSPSHESGILSEIRVGALRHDAGIFTTQNEPDVVDANVEILFTSPDFLRYVWSPRPHLGVTGNFTGATSQAYLGLTWDIDLFRGLFLELGFGASVHNGELDSGDPYGKNLGCRWLFRGSGALGYRVSEHHNISVMLDHVSNSYLCDQNDGLDTLGVRWGYRF